MTTDFEKILKQYWGYDSFRQGQREIIQSICSGKDTLAVLPTGAGKSICYQLPAVVYDGLTIVISPLISLIKDQVESLKKRGIKAEALLSGQKYRTQDIILDNAAHGMYKLLFVSPERLKTKLFVERLKKMNLSLIAVDEAHCISEWGHDFRPEYREISQIRELYPEVPVIAVTATATSEVQEDITSNLTFGTGSKKYTYSPVRDNLHYKIVETEDKLGYIISNVKRYKEQHTLIYVPSRKQTVLITKNLAQHGIVAAPYHGGMSIKDRHKVSENWAMGKLKCVVATKAFGMGIDKSDVRLVMHYFMPETLESYVQEAGRAGRDGKNAECTLLYNLGDVHKVKEKLEKVFPPKVLIKDVFKKLCNHYDIAKDTMVDEDYPYNHAKFCNEYKFNAFKAISAIKLLSKAEHISISEEVLHPSKLILEENGIKRLLAGKKATDKMKSFIKLLLRNYESLFLEKRSIDEGFIADRFNVTEEKVVQALQWIAKIGIGEYDPKFEGGIIRFNGYRTASSEIDLPDSIYLSQKERYLDRSNKMISYIQNLGCRQIYIAKYFGFNSYDRCNMCDNCMTADKNDLNRVGEIIIDYLKSNSGTDHKKLINAFPKIEMSDIKSAISLLETERKISIDLDNVLRIS